MTTTTEPKKKRRRPPNNRTPEPETASVATEVPDIRLSQGADVRPSTTKPAPVRIIEVVCPTLNRPKEATRLEEALAQCVVPEGVAFGINVYRETTPRALPVAVNERLSPSVADIEIVLADHIVPDSRFLEAITAAFADKFPDLDGMVGLNLANMPPLPGVREYCFFALGRKFIERFPYAQVLCPQYHHFYADTELGEFATDAGLFHWAEDARVETFHVNNGKAQKDGTWAASRSRKAQDDAMWTARQARGLLWGKTFEREEP